MDECFGLAEDLTLTKQSEIVEITERESDERSIVVDLSQKSPNQNVVLVVDDSSPSSITLSDMKIIVTPLKEEKNLKSKKADEPEKEIETSILENEDTINQEKNPVEVEDILETMV